MSGQTARSASGRGSTGNGLCCKGRQKKSAEGGHPRRSNRLAVPAKKKHPKEEEEMQKRQGFSEKGIARRLRDAQLGRVRDTGRKGWVRYSVKSILHLVTLTMMSGGKSIRKCEQRSAGLKDRFRRSLSIPRRIADNTVGMALRNLSWEGVLWALVRLIKAEHRRGNIKADYLPIAVQRKVWALI